MLRFELPVLPLLALAVLGFGGCSASLESGTPDRGTDPASPGASRGAGPREAGPREAGPREAPNADAGPPDVELLVAEITTVGWDELSGSPVVLLREVDSGQVLPIWIGIAEARAISLELHGVELTRPMTHDLMVDLLHNLDAELEEVVVHDLREGTYYGLLKLRLAGRAEPRWIDTRPSDGLALALRTNARIRVSKKLIDDLPDYRFQAPDTPEQVVRALGLTVVAADEVWRRELELPDRPGIVVLAAAGEAQRRGLRRGDLIVDIDGRTPHQPLDLLQAMTDAPAGGTLRVTYWREGSEYSAELSLAGPGRRSEADKVA
jgi:bifunctional DNase/RNase